MNENEPTREDILLRALADLIIWGLHPPRMVREDHVGTLHLVTCETVDAGFETAVRFPNDDAVRLAEYPDEETAILGHNHWVEKLPFLEVVTDIGYKNVVPPKEVKIVR